MKIRVTHTTSRHWAEIGDEVEVINDKKHTSLYIVAADKDITIGGARVIKKSCTEIVK